MQHWGDPKQSEQVGPAVTNRLMFRRPRVLAQRKKGPLAVAVTGKISDGSINRGIQIRPKLPYDFPEELMSFEARAWA